MTPPSPVVYPGYTLLSKLGKGGLSTVYLARQDALSREVAFKVLSADVARQEGFGARFLREARIVASLNHRNIVQVHDTGEVQGNYFLAMEYLPRGDLSRLTGGPMPPSDALRIVSSVLEALEFAASRGIVHRDVKPANIMFREDGTVVLVDFGIAFRDAPDERVTRVGTIIGTPSYMSPEQFDSRDVDGRSDIYSVGVVLFELLSGRVPFAGDTAVGIALSHRTSPLPRLGNGLDAFQPILDRALAKEPGERFSDAGEFLDALAGLSGSVYAGAGTAVAVDAQWDDGGAGTDDSDMTRPRDAGTGSARPATDSMETVEADRGGAGALLDTASWFGAVATQPLRRRSAATEAAAGAWRRAAGLSERGLTGVVVVGVCVVAIAALMLATRDGPVPNDAEAGDTRRVAGTPPEVAEQEPVATGEDTSAPWRRALVANRDALLESIRLLQPDDPALAVERVRADYAALFSGPGRPPDAVRADERLLRESLEYRLRRAPRRFTAGSTPRQIETAFQTCRAADPGCERSWYSSETLREVSLAPFRLAAAEVSIAEFGTFTRATRYTTVAQRRAYSYDYTAGGLKEVSGVSWRRPDSRGDPPDAQWPVTHIAWSDAAAYCRWRGGRLPTAEEWEYAARGPERRTYTWGEAWNPSLAPLGTAHPQTVGSLEQDAYFAGVADLTGNVWEWVRLASGRYGLKGGSHLESSPNNMRAAVRRDQPGTSSGNDLATITLPDYGIRCAYDSEQWPPTRPVDPLAVEHQLQRLAQLRGSRR